MNQNASTDTPAANPATPSASAQGSPPDESRLLRIKVGRMLADARQGAGWDVDQLAAATRINASFIQALERGDFNGIPGAVFGRGFIRSLCRAMNVDPEPIIEAFVTATGAERADRKSASRPQVQMPDGSVLQTAQQTLRDWYAHRRLTARLIADRTAQRISRRGALNWRTWSPQKKQAILAALASALVVTILGVGTSRWVYQRSRDTTPPAAAESTAAQQASAALDEGSMAAPNPAPTGTDPSSAVAGSSASSPASGSPQDTTVVAGSSSPLSEEDAAAADPLPPEPPREALKGPRRGIPGDTAQELVLTVVEKVTVRTKVDRGAWQQSELAPDTYRYAFRERLDLLLLDAGAVSQVTYNGRELGSLGAKGRVRRLSFVPPAAATAPTARRD